jgi:nucleoside-diphosphate-sugar epimerase
MRILLTGGTGFIGSHTAAALGRDGHELRLLVRDPEKAKRVFEGLEADLPECVTGDVTDAGSVSEALSGCDGVLHAAALVALDQRSAREVERTNLAGTRNVVGLAHERGLSHVVYVSSTAALFDPEGEAPIGPGSEPASTAQGSAYAASKAESERWLRELQARGAAVSATYPGAVLGPHAPSLTEAHRALPFQLRAMPISEGGLNVVDVRDLADIHVALFRRPPESERWIAGGPFLDFAALADVIERVTGRRVLRVPVPGAVLRGLGRLGDWARHVVSFDLPLSHEAMVTATRWPGVDSSRTLTELGASFRDPAETFADTLVWMHQAGHVGARAVGRLADRAGPARASSA